MKTDLRASQLLSWSVKVYRALLVLYPADFRQQYERHMVQVFRDVCRDVYGEGGTSGLMNWWATALFDLLQSVLVERKKGGLMMSQSKFIQWSGWLCIVGGLCFVVNSFSQLQGLAGMYQPLALYALAPGMVLIMLGLMGVWLRYKAKLNLFGMLALLTTLIGAGITAAGWFLALTGGFAMNVFFIGWMIQLAGHTVFGGFAATTHLLPKWNWSLLIGSALPLTVIVLALSQIQMQFSAGLAGFAMLMLIGIGWILAGVALNSQAVEKVQPAASV